MSNQFNSLEFSAQATTMAGFNKLHSDSNYIHQQQLQIDFIEPPDEWSCETVAQWLAINDLSDHIQSFLEKEIDGEKLLNMDSTKLKVNKILFNLKFDQLELNLFFLV